MDQFTFFSWEKLLNPFVPNAPFLYPRKALVIIKTDKKIGKTDRDDQQNCSVCSIFFGKSSNIFARFWTQNSFDILSKCISKFCFNATAYLTRFQINVRDLDHCPIWVYFNFVWRELQFYKMFIKWEHCGMFI